MCPGSARGGDGQCPRSLHLSSSSQERARKLIGDTLELFMWFANGFSFLLERLAGRRQTPSEI